MVRSRVTWHFVSGSPERGKRVAGSVSRATQGLGGGPVSGGTRVGGAGMLENMVGTSAAIAPVATLNECSILKTTSAWSRCGALRRNRSCGPNCDHSDEEK